MTIKKWQLPIVGERENFGELSMLGGDIILFFLGRLKELGGR